MKYYVNNTKGTKIIKIGADRWFGIAGLTARAVKNPFINMDRVPEEIAEEVSPEVFDKLVSNDANNQIELYRRACELAKKAHAGQADKAGVDYFEGHLKTVSDYAARRNIPYGAIVGILHDILEDTAITEEELREQFPDIVVDAVVAMTKKPEDSYFDYIENLKLNDIAKEVKICDIEHNIDITRLGDKKTDSDISRILKYAKALAYLLK